VVCQSDCDEQCDSRNPTNAVGGSFILSLQGKLGGPLNPTNAVGGSFILSLNPLFPVRRQDMNNPPTALVGFGSGAAALV